MERERDSDMDDDQVSKEDLSLMDRTKRQAKTAQDNLRKNSKALSSMDEEALGLEELLTQSRKKADASNAARARVSDHDPEPEVVQPAPASPNIGALLAASIQSMVIFLWLLFRLYWLFT